jgi:hypothetical protein
MVGLASRDVSIVAGIPGAGAGTTPVDEVAPVAFAGSTVAGSVSIVSSCTCVDVVAVVGLAPAPAPAPYAAGSRYPFFLPDKMDLNRNAC